MAICKNNQRISLLTEGYPRMGFQTFSKIIGSGSKGVCITRLHPEYVAQKYGLGGTRCYWLSGCKGKGVLSPKNLGQVAKAVKGSLAGGEGNLIFLDGLEYLLLYNDMGKVLSFLTELEASLTKAGGEMVVCMDPLTLEQKDLDRLWSAFPRCTPEELSKAFLSSQSPHSAAAAPLSVDQTV